MLSLVRTILGAGILFGATRLSSLLAHVAQKPTEQLEQNTHATTRQNALENPAPDSGFSASPHPEEFPVSETRPENIPIQSQQLSETYDKGEDDDGFEEIWSPDGKPEPQAKPKPKLKHKVLSTQSPASSPDAPLPSPDPDYRKFGRD
jgi:hypothetical protein